MLRDLETNCWAPALNTLATPSDVGELSASAALFSTRPGRNSSGSSTPTALSVAMSSDKDVSDVVAAQRNHLEIGALLDYFVASLGLEQIKDDDDVLQTLLTFGIGSADDRLRVLNAVRDVRDRERTPHGAAGNRRDVEASPHLAAWLDVCFGRRVGGLPAAPPATPAFARAATLVRRSSSRLTRTSSEGNDATPGGGFDESEFSDYGGAPQAGDGEFGSGREVKTPSPPPSPSIHSAWPAIDLDAPFVGGGRSGSATPGGRSSPAGAVGDCTAGRSDGGHAFALDDPSAQRPAITRVQSSDSITKWASFSRRETIIGGRASQQPDGSVTDDASLGGHADETAEPETRDSARVPSSKVQAKSSSPSTPGSSRRKSRRNNTIRNDRRRRAREQQKITNARSRELRRPKHHPRVRRRRRAAAEAWLFVGAKIGRPGQQVTITETSFEKGTLAGNAQGTCFALGTMESAALRVAGFGSGRMHQNKRTKAKRLMKVFIKVGLRGLQSQDHFVEEARIQDRIARKTSCVPDVIDAFALWDETPVSAVRGASVGDHNAAVSRIKRTTARGTRNVGTQNVVSGGPVARYLGYCIVMRAADSPKTLLDELIEGRHTRDSEMFSVARRCLECVAAVHHEQFVHCDVKPEHFMRFNGGELKLIDLGSARLVFAAVHSEITPDYAAPELYTSLDMKRIAIAAKAQSLQHSSSRSSSKSSQRGGLRDRSNSDGGGGSDAAAAAAALQERSSERWLVVAKTKKKAKRGRKKSATSSSSTSSSASKQGTTKTLSQSATVQANDMSPLAAQSTSSSSPILATTRGDASLRFGMDVWSCAVTLCFIFRMTAYDIRMLQQDYSSFGDLFDILPVDRMKELSPIPGRDAGGRQLQQEQQQIEERCEVQRAQRRILSEMLKEECDDRPSIEKILRKRYFRSAGTTDTLQQSHAIVLALFAAPRTYNQRELSSLPEAYGSQVCFVFSYFSSRVCRLNILY